MKSGTPNPRRLRLCGVHADAVLGDDVAQEGNRRATELTLTGFGKKLVVAKSLQHHADVNQVLLLRLGEDEDVVHVDLHESTQHGFDSHRSTAPPVASNRDSGRPKIACM